MTTSAPEAYAPRRFSDLGILQVDEWRLKRTGIAYAGDQPSSRLVAAADRVARQALPRPAVTPSRYGLGFLGVHEGQNGSFVFVDWWINRDELIHRPFVAPLDDPEALRPGGPEQLTACVWDLAVICHERQAWVEEMMGNPDGAAAYLARVFTGLH